MRLLPSVLTSVLCLAPVAVNAAGPPPIEYVDPVNVTTVEGSPTAATLISHAQQMPVVQLAMSEMSAMGLSRNSSSDVAGFSGDTTVVALAYTAPGYSNVYGILWAFSIQTSSTSAETWVIGGAYTYNPSTESFSAPPSGLDDLVGNIADMTSTEPENYEITKRSDAHKLLDYGLCVLGEGLTLGQASAICGPYAPACATVGVIFATIHCAFHAFETN